MLTFNKVVNKSQQSFFSKGSSQKEVSVDIRVNVDMDSGKIKLTVPGDSRQNVQKSPVRPILNQKPTTTSTQHPFFGYNSSAYSAASSISHRSQPSSLSSHEVLKVPLPPPKDIYCVLCKRSYQPHYFDYHIKLHREGQQKEIPEPKSSGFVRKYTPYFGQVVQQLNQATGQSVGQTVGQPLSQPTSQPSSQPVRQPTAQPTIQQAAQQIPQPVLQPTLQQTPTITEIRSAYSIGRSQSSAKSLSVANKSLNQQNMSGVSRSSQEPRPIMMNGSFNNLNAYHLQQSLKSQSIPSVQDITPQLPYLRTLTNKSNSNILPESVRSKDIRISRYSNSLSRIPERSNEISMHQTIVKTALVHHSQAIIEPALSEQERGAQSQPDPTIMDRLSDSRADFLWQSMVYGDYNYDRQKRPWEQTPDVLASKQSNPVSNSSSGGRPKMPKNLFAVELAIDQKVQNSKKQGYF